MIYLEHGQVSSRSKVLNHFETGSYGVTMAPALESASRD
jgi:hypothetical protein